MRNYIFLDIGRSFAHIARASLLNETDNTLYSASTGISAAMGKKIHGKSLSPSFRVISQMWHPDYFTTLGLEEEEASALHLKYYTQYGLG
jgi:pyrimidine and pyridine-specific 5'-nucleotidase